MNRTSEMEHILICLKEHIALSDDEDNLLLDYITNLQQENERLKDNAIHNDKVVDKVNWENMLLKKENKATLPLEYYDYYCTKIIGNDFDYKIVKE